MLWICQAANGGSATESHAPLGFKRNGWRRSSALQKVRKSDLEMDLEFWKLMLKLMLKWFGRGPLHQRYLKSGSWNAFAHSYWQFRSSQIHIVLGFLGQKTTPRNVPLVPLSKGWPQRIWLSGARFALRYGTPANEWRPRIPHASRCFSAGEIPMLSPVELVQMA